MNLPINLHNHKTKPKKFIKKSFYKNQSNLLMKEEF